MSKMKNLVIEIEELIQDGYEWGEIARMLSVPVQWVSEVAENMEPEYNDSMDGDHESALASAGFGTDEDYGYYGDDCEF